MGAIRPTMMNSFKAAVVYFTLVLGTGFVLGTIRVPRSRRGPREGFAFFRPPHMPHVRTRSTTTPIATSSAPSLKQARGSLTIPTTFHNASMCALAHVPHFGRRIVEKVWRDEPAEIMETLNYLTSRLPYRWTLSTAPGFHRSRCRGMTQARLCSDVSHCAKCVCTMASTP